MKKITTFSKIFGSGPVGLLTSLVLLFIANLLKNTINLPSISNNHFILKLIFIFSGLTTLIIIVWSFKSLPAADRGNKLYTTGAFRYVRHPLYAAFLSVFNFGLAIFFNNYIFVLWAILLHPTWHYIVKYEERLMIGIFGNDYINYEKHTGRFFPRLWKQ